MPELPDLEAYLHALRARIQGVVLESVHVKSPFVLRTVEPALSACHGRRVTSLRRLGKRIVLGLEGEHFLVIHLMISMSTGWQSPRDPNEPLETPKCDAPEAGAPDIDMSLIEDNLRLTVAERIQQHSLAQALAFELRLAMELRREQSRVNSRPGDRPCARGLEGSV